MKHFEQIVRQEFTAQITRYRDQKIVSNMALELFPTEHIPGIVIEMTQRLLSMDHVQDHEETEAENVWVEIHYDIDASWWQSFRRRFFPRWWLKKHPVVTSDRWQSKNYTCRVVHKHYHTNVCPHIDLSQHNGNHYDFLINGKATL